MADELDPNDGHAWRIAISDRGSYGIAGREDEGHHFSGRYSPESTVVVQAWNLPDALRKAAELPLAAWFPEEETSG
jgi:hypothetical protein